MGDNYKPYILHIRSDDVPDPIVIKRISHIPEKFSHLHKALCLQDKSRREAKAKFRKSILDEYKRRDEERNNRQKSQKN